jgi:hypothetical protein
MIIAYPFCCTLSEDDASSTEEGFFKKLLIKILSLLNLVCC